MNSSFIAVIAVIAVLVLSVIICDIRETRRLKEEEAEEEKARQRKASCGNACTNEYHGPIENVSVPICCYVCKAYGGCR